MREILRNGSLLACINSSTFVLWGFQPIDCQALSEGLFLYHQRHFWGEKGESWGDSDSFRIIQVWKVRFLKSWSPESWKVVFYFLVLYPSDLVLLNATCYKAEGKVSSIFMKLWPKITHTPSNSENSNFLDSLKLRSSKKITSQLMWCVMKEVITVLLITHKCCFIPINDIND